MTVPLPRNDRFLGRPVRCGEAVADFAVGDEVRRSQAPGYGDAPPGLVSAVQVGPDGFVYGVSWVDKDHDVYHYGFELVAEEPAELPTRPIDGDD